MSQYYDDERSPLIHCDKCGEDYADTYRSCPFCKEARANKSSKGARNAKSGRKVRTNTRGGGYGGARSPLSMIGIVIAIVLLIAAVIIVIALLKNTLSGKNSKTDADAETSVSDTETDETEDGDASATREILITPDDQILDQTELTLSEDSTTATIVATTDPSGWVGTISWSSSDEGVATVNQNGVVTYVADGTCTITASAAGIEATCTVICDSTIETATVTTLVVKAFGSAGEDFTFSIGETIYFKAEGGDGENYSWSIADAGVASVNPTTGECTGLGVGNTTLTVTSGDESLSVIIRIKSAS